MKHDPLLAQVREKIGGGNAPAAIAASPESEAIPQPALRSVFRARFRDGYADLAKEHALPAIDSAVWKKDWGVHLQPFGSGEHIIKYLGRYVCRTAIGDSRILSVSDTHVSFLSTLYCSAS